MTRGIGKTVALDDNIKVSWIELALAIAKVFDASPERLQNHLRTHYKEYVNKVTHWDTMQKVVARVPRSALLLIEQWMQEHHMATVAIPITWVRDPCLVSRCLVMQKLFNEVIPINVL